ncbi:MAG: hypothetical protein HYX39_02755 [Bacteroidetes bacterium]|nr:hypothetical protein [Bacteroidota bacterium]
MKKILLLLILFVTLAASAQPPTRFFSKFGGGGIDIGYGVKETFNRQYIIVGSTTSFGFGNADVYLNLLDSMGQLVWSKSYGGAQAEVAKSIIVNPSDSGFVFVGYTNSFGNGGYDVFIIRTDKSGVVKWQTTLGGADWDFGSDLTFSTDGNIILCGNSYSNGYGQSDGFVAKINISNGAKIWEKYYGGSADDDFQSIILASDGSIALGGNTKSYGDLNNDFWLFKINNLGDSLSSKKFGTVNKAERCYDMMEDNLNNLIFCGSYDTSYYNTGKNDAYIVKTNLNGTFINDIKFTGAGSGDKFISVTKSTIGNNYCFSRSVFKPGFAIEAQPFLTDVNFGYINSTTYAGVNDEEAYAIINTKDNGFLMIGYTKSFNSFSEDVFIVKLDNSLLNASNIVGVGEAAILQTKRNLVYFFNNTFYFDNKDNLELTYSIWNSQGILVQKNVTNNDKIPLNEGLFADIYVIMVENKIPLKFIKQ